jgi:hypothetical protein
MHLVKQAPAPVVLMPKPMPPIEHECSAQIGGESACKRSEIELPIHGSNAAKLFQPKTKARSHNDQNEALKRCDSGPPTAGGGQFFIGKKQFRDGDGEQKQNDRGRQMNLHFPPCFKC